MQNLLLRVAELERKLTNVLIIGVITDVDNDRALVQVTAGELVTGWLPWLTQKAGGDITYWSPEINEQVMILSPGGKVEMGVVLPALYQQSADALSNAPNIHRTKYKDGAVIEYDRDAHHLKAILPDGGTVEVKADMTIIGNLKVTKEITDKTRSMSADRAIYNTHTHQVTGHSLANATSNQQ